MNTYKITIEGYIADESGNVLCDENGQAHRPKYYSVFDRDTGNYMATGRNSRSLETLGEEMFSYMANGLEDDEIKTYRKQFITNPVEELGFFNFEVVGHDKKL
jgi:hypothetical protein